MLPVPAFSPEPLEELDAAGVAGPSGVGDELAVQATNANRVKEMDVMASARMDRNTPEVGRGFASPTDFSRYPRWRSSVSRS